MALVVVVFLGEDGVEEVTLHVVVGPGSLVKHAVVLALLLFLLAEVGAVGPEEENGPAVVGGDAEGELAEFVGLHLHGGDIVLEDEFTDDGYLFLQAFVVNTKVGIDNTLGVGGILYIDGCTHLFHLDGAALRLCHEIVGGGGLITIHALYPIITLFQSDIAGGIGFCDFRIVAEDTCRPVVHFARFDLDGIGGGVDASLHSHGLFGLIAKGCATGNLLIVVASPALYHHQQVKGTTVLLVV